MNKITPVVFLIVGGNVKGKADCENMCLNGSSFTSICGPCLNPHDLTRTTGGSSSGSGALVIFKRYTSSARTILRSELFYKSLFISFETQILKGLRDRMFSLYFDYL